MGNPARSVLAENSVLLFRSVVAFQGMALPGWMYPLLSGWTSGQALNFFTCHCLVNIPMSRSCLLAQRFNDYVIVCWRNIMLLYSSTTVFFSPISAVLNSE